jgi:hypothetical protein
MWIDSRDIYTDVEANADGALDPEVQIQTVWITVSVIHDFLNASPICNKFTEASGQLQM